MNRFSRVGLRSAFAGLAMFVPLAGLHAQEISEEHLNAAKAAIASINATDAFDSILPEIAQSLAIRLVANNPDLEQAINDFTSEEAIKLAARRADLENEAAKAYARAFRQEDLTAIAEFYESEAGKALLANGPIVSREVAAAAAVWRRGLERDLQENVSNRLREADLRAVEPAPAEETEQTTE